MLNDEHTVFTRAELANKTGHELVLPPEMAENTYRSDDFKPKG